MSRRSDREPIQIMLVEDNLGDIRLTREILEECDVPNRLTVVRDGEEAMACLRREGRHAATPRPDLILLDLNLPRKNGREVLAEVKNDLELRRIPILILTTSSAQRDVFESYDLHANCYLTKPVRLDEFIGLVRSIESFWFTIVRLPN